MSQPRQRLGLLCSRRSTRALGAALAALFAATAEFMLCSLKAAPILGSGLMEAVLILVIFKSTPSFTVFLYSINPGVFLKQLLFHALCSFLPKFSNQLFYRENLP
jgi:hypothetical protein